MSVDELRAGFRRLTDPVLPSEDPYGEVLRRARSRRRNRFAGFGAAGAALLALALSGPAIVGVGGWQGAPPSEGYPVESEWTWRLIDSPTRGNLAGDTELVSDLTRALADESPLPGVKVLFVHDFARSRVALVADYSDSAASLSVLREDRGASAGDLARSDGLRNARLDPFVNAHGLLGDEEVRVSFWQLGLAPAGCTVATSEHATIGPDGAVRRVWQPAPTGDYAVSEEMPAARWRTTCDGVVRQEGPVEPGIDEIDDLAAPSDPEAASDWTTLLDRPTGQAALASYQELVGPAGLAATRPVVRWAGTVTDGAHAVPAALLGPATGPGAVVLQVGAESKALVALVDNNQATPDDSATGAANRAGWSLVAPGTADDSGVIAVRVPARAGGRAVASDRMLVVGPASAATVEAVDATGAVVGSARMERGAAILILLTRDEVTLRVLDATGKQVVATVTPEHAAGQQLFGEPIVSAW
ncbi:hypothetical protein [Micromonospora sp. NBC_01796]|uniref:hypothetical protein n=1 Tax=Micromonospora sp. NBC_01796 TaxID=2975987 RepID=UPI002DDAFA44|nr:hypothetical protein [Micromonospora sp. NBC_01796]WSA84482.1 hypothetical protein OIE47_29615 [Micromonospora sp. NBC_01796]